MELVIINNGQPVTNSLLVAEKFKKRHADVMRDISNLSCSDDFRLRNFALMFNIRELPNGGNTKDNYYQMTKAENSTFIENQRVANQKDRS